MNLFIAYVAFWSSLSGIPTPRVVSKTLPHPIAARVMVVGFKDDGLRYFYNEVVIEADPRKIKSNPREYALHEVCHIRFATSKHDKMFEYCMQVYKDRANKRKQ